MVPQTAPSIEHHLAPGRWRAVCGAAVVAEEARGVLEARQPRVVARETHGVAVIARPRQVRTSRLILDRRWPALDYARPSAPEIRTSVRPVVGRVV